MRLHLPDRALFVRKTATVFVLAFVLVPLVDLKHQLPALIYAGALVALHVVVLGVYLYRVRFRELDADWRSLVARVMALVLVTYLLSAVSGFEEGTPQSWLAAQMFGISMLHTSVLALLMVRVERVEPVPAREMTS